MSLDRTRREVLDARNAARRRHVAEHGEPTDERLDTMRAEAAALGGAP